MAQAQLPNEPDYNRNIAPVTDEEPESLSDEESELAGGNIAENEDGSATFSLPEEDSAEQSDHYDNLVEHLDAQELGKISLDLMEKIDRDKTSRKERDEQYADGIKRTGLGGEAPGGASFAGASRVVHPMLAEACVDFASRAIKELFPSDGPVKTKIFGTVTQQKVDAANRQRDCLNWQLTEKVPEYVTELEQTLTQLPMGGSQYIKFYDDRENDIWTCEFVPIDDLYIPFSCSSFQKAPRLTHYQRLTRQEYEDRVEDGFYIDTQIGGATEPETTQASEASAKIEGKEKTSPDIDDTRAVFEIKVKYKVSVDDDEPLPYLISINETTGKVVAIYRNWDESDENQKPLDWIVEWGFIPWRGAYHIGLPHLIGGLSAAATGALRALMDSAHINNAATALMLKGAGINAQTAQPEVTQITEIEAPIGVDDIRKVAMPMPFPPPSQVLFMLLGWLTDAAKGVVTTAEEKISEASNQMPVGTALALIEQGSKVYSAIHRRLHRSQRRCLQIIARLNSHLPIEKAQQDELGEILATRKDFGRPLAVSPVSDPDIFSEAQRFAQIQFAMGLSGTAPQLYNMYELHHKAMQQAKIQDIDMILPPPKNPTQLNAPAENLALMMGQPIIAFPDQAHLAHLVTHFQFLLDPLLGSNPMMLPKILPPMMDHVMQHVGLQYATVIHDVSSEAMGSSVGDALGQDPKKNPGLSAKIDQLLAAAAKITHAGLQQQFQSIAPILLHFAQQVVQMQQSMPQNPALALQGKQIDMTAQIADAENKRKSAIDQGTLALKAQEASHKAQNDQAKLAQETKEGDAAIVIDSERVNLERQRDALQLEEQAQPGNQIPGV